MGVTRVKPSQPLEQDANGKRVSADYDIDARGELAALAACPFNLGSGFTDEYGTADNSLLCVSRKVAEVRVPALVAGTGNGLYRVVCAFSTNPNIAATAPSPNPAQVGARPVVESQTSWGSSPADRDKDGKPVVTRAGQPYTPLPTRPVPVGHHTITWYEANINNLDTYRTSWEGMLNRSVFIKKPARCVLCDTVVAKPYGPIVQFVATFQSRLPIPYKDDSGALQQAGGWDTVLPERGTLYYKSAADHTLLQAPVGGDCKLKANGTLAGDSDPVLNTVWQMIPDADFAIPNLT